MGLKLTLSKEANGLGYDFIDAYWVISKLEYQTIGPAMTANFCLDCFPTRESSKRTGDEVGRISIGKPEMRLVNGLLYRYEDSADASALFPEGIPISIDEQKTQIYTYIKDYTGLPFEDVFEDAETEAEPAHEEPAVEPEPVVQDPEPKTVEDPVEEPETEAAPETEPEPEVEPEPETEEPDEEPAAAETEPAPEPEVHNPLSL